MATNGSTEVTETGTEQWRGSGMVSTILHPDLRGIILF